MLDVLLYETGNGGDFVLAGGDLEQTSSFYNMVYLAWFGGNVEAVTRQDEIENEQRFDYWANSLLWPGENGLQFNSRLEKLLNESPITSASRLKIEEVAKADLAFMRDFGDVEVTTRIVALNHLEIKASITQPDSSEDKVVKFIWDATKQELITEAPAGKPFRYPRKNILINGLFNGTENWNSVQYTGGFPPTEELNGSLKYTCISALNDYKVVTYSDQKFVAGRTYLITGKCLTFTVDVADEWGINFIDGSSGSYFPDSPVTPNEIIITGTGDFAQEITVPTTFVDPDDIRLIICPSANSNSTGIFEITDLKIKGVD